MNDNYKYFLKYLACPHTKNKLELQEEGKEITLKSDIERYQIKNDIPILISKLNYNDTTDKSFIDSIEDFWNSGWEKRRDESDHSFLYQLTEQEFSIRINEKYNEQELRGKGIGHYFSNEIKRDSLKNKTCIIVGPGCGEEAIELSFLTKANVIGVDISYNSASLTNTLLHKFGDKTGIGIQGDSRFLPIQSNTIDFVFSNGVIHHSPNIQKSVDEIYRVLKPNGKFCVALYHKHSIAWLKFLLKAFLKGNWTQNKMNRYISSQTELSWVTGNKKNPHTKLFSSSDCSKIFSRFNDLKIRPGNFHTPNNFYLKFFRLFENTKIMSNFGGMIYISGSK